MNILAPKHQWKCWQLKSFRSHQCRQFLYKFVSFDLHMKSSALIYNVNLFLTSSESGISSCGCLNRPPHTGAKACHIIGAVGV